MEFDAQVIAAFGRHLVVRDAAGQEHRARPFGRRMQAVCGDYVRCEADVTHGEVHALQVLPRRSALMRSSVRGASEPVVANLSLLVVVVAPAPAADLFIVDRYLCAAASGGIQALLVMNKSDLPGASALRDALEPFRTTGYDIVSCCVHRRDGLDALREALRAHTSALVGQSGVGKSSIVTSLVPGAEAAAGTLDRDDEGRHTTTRSALFDLPGGGALIDSPGVRDFAPAIDALEPRSLGFVEVDRLAPGCRFQDCRHLREPGCAVRDAAEKGNMDPRRYESYRRLRRLHDELTAARGHGRGGTKRPGGRGGD